jgi:hypothetical protein
VAEAAFLRHKALAAVKELVSMSDACVVHCELDRAAARTRFANRASSDPIRRKSHPDDEVLSAMAGGTFEWDQYEPIDLGVPLMRVNTATTYSPSLDAIVAFARGR